METYAYQPRDRRRLTVKDINQSKRPRLAKEMKSSGRDIYALTDIPTKRHDTGQRIIVLQEGEEAATLISDEIIDGQETFKCFTLPATAVATMGRILMQETLLYLQRQVDDLRHKEYKQGGRPKKYLMADIVRVIRLHDGGMSIRKIAKKEGMSPTTVQKLLKYKDIKDDLIAISADEETPTEKMKQ